MKRVIVEISFLGSESGGRSQPIPAMHFGCPVFFEGVPALSAHGYDCRLLVSEYGKLISPGDVVKELSMVFLSPDEVLPHIQQGTRFTLWEGKTIARGVISRLESLVSG